MVRNYYVTYDKWDGSQVKQVTVCIGKFWDDSAAEQAAYEFAFRKGIELNELRRETALEAKLSAVGDAVLWPAIRAMRFCLAATVVFLSLPLFSSLGDIGEVPLAEVTLSMLASAFFHGLLLLGLVCLVLWIAFGASGRPMR